jgi:hypothetical protein
MFPGILIVLQYYCYTYNEIPSTINVFCYHWSLYNNIYIVIVDHSGRAV